MIEIWKPLRNTNEEIEISNLGQVKRVALLKNKGAKEYIYSNCVGGSGTMQCFVCMTNKKRRMVMVAREVLIAFGGAVNPFRITYKDGSIYNCRVDNLEFVERCAENYKTKNYAKRKAAEPKGMSLYEGRDCSQCAYYPCIIGRNENYVQKTHFAQCGCIKYKKL